MLFYLTAKSLAPSEGVYCPPFSAHPMHYNCLSNSGMKLNHFFLACVRLQITALRCTFPAFTVLWGIRALPGAVADCLHTTSRDAHHPFAGDGRKSRKPRQDSFVPLTVYSQTVPAKEWPFSGNLSSLPSTAVRGRLGTRDGTGPSLSTGGRHTRKDGDGVYPSSGDTTPRKVACACRDCGHNPGHGPDAGGQNPMAHHRCGERENPALRAERHPSLAGALPADWPVRDGVRAYARVSSCVFAPHLICTGRPFDSGSGSEHVEG
ncbi:hypothetical protein B0H14DRAFT_2597658 [Mycena olivaceomarginata]|nr:hypothetical protein B0H14DRAFT_2597658 [Mycena olivaceomarginata]